MRPSGETAPGDPRSLAGIRAMGAPESPGARLARAATGLAVALAAAGLVFAAGSFAWGAARTLHGPVLPRLLALLALVIAVRVLRRSGPAPLLAGPDRTRAWRDRVAGLAEAGLVIVAVASALEPLWRLLRRLAQP